MKFGRIDNPERVSFGLPKDHSDTNEVLLRGSSLKNAFVGCAKWNKQELKNFYPRGVKDELVYYSSQFNSIELNATFYGYFSNEKLSEWSSKVPNDFRFFPKVPRVISHMKRLLNVEEDILLFEKSLTFFNGKAEMCFLQLQENFSPANMQRLKQFVSIWPSYVPLAIELRDREWFHNETISSELIELFKQNNITNIITDTAGFRELLHMRLSSTTAFIRFVGANHKTDYTRLDEWISRIKEWIDQGLEHLYFFVHQNEEKESTMLAHYFINKLRPFISIDLRGPTTLSLDL